MPLEPSTRKKRGLFDTFILIVAVVEPLTTLPQIYEIWVRKNLEGVSLATWSLYTLTAAVWLVYGIKVKDRPVTISSLMWVLTEGFVVLGLLIY